MSELRKLLFEGSPAVRVVAAALLVLLLVSSASAAGTFVWDQYDSGIWSEEDNWTGPATCTVDCYPHTTDDDVIIEDDSEDIIELDDDYTIDDLTILAVECASKEIRSTNSTARELSCDSLVMNGCMEVYLGAKVTVIARD